MNRISPLVATQRLLIATSLIAGLGYPWLEGHLAPVAAMILKGLGVGLLAIVALLSPGQRWLAAIMAAGALGDVLLELPGGLVPGGGSFAIGHVVAMIFYARNRRQPPLPVASIAAAGLILYGLAMPALVLPAGTPMGALMLYAVLLCGMAAAALISRFPLALTAAGALLFVLSDTFLVMRLGGRIIGSPTIHGLIVWYGYYLGQLGIFAGIFRSPAAR
jgi:uncharacterized membrane protein YhhN